jgi:hypothetical protein
MTRADFKQPPHVGEDRCLDLVQDLLDPADRSIALDHMQECSACEQRFQVVAASHARALSAAAALRGRAPVTGAPLRLRPRTRPWLLAAAGVVALLGVARFARQSPTESLVAIGPSVRLPPAHLRGAIRDLQVSDADTMIAAGLRAYNRGDYTGARRRLETATISGRLETVRRIYLGSTLFELGDAADAVLLLRDLDLTRVPEPWKSETQWTLALALESCGHAAAADSILTLLSRQHNPAGERARAHRAARPHRK